MSRDPSRAGSLLIVGLSLVSTAALPAAPSQTRSFILEAPCERVFPLFTAEGERLGPRVGARDPERVRGTRQRLPDRDPRP